MNKNDKIIIGESLEPLEMKEELQVMIDRDIEYDKEQSAEELILKFEGTYEDFLIQVGNQLVINNDFPKTKYDNLIIEMSENGNPSDKEAYKHIIIEIAEIRGYKLETENENLHRLTLGE